MTLATPKGDATRPATDAMRQAVFSSLAARVAGATFLDLFAGSGAYGLEAFSRGATGGLFVEKDPGAAACIQQNIAGVGKSMKSTTIALKVAAADVMATSWPMAELVFIDPPYEIISEVAPKLFARLNTQLTSATADPLVIFEMPGELDLLPEGWTCVKRLGKGVRQPTICIFRANQALL